MFLVLSVLDNTNHILSKTKQSYSCSVQVEDVSDVDLNLLISNFQTQKSFYNKSERKISNTFQHQDYCSTNINETIPDNYVTMDLTSKYLDNFVH